MGELILVPTPLQDDLPLEPTALKRLMDDCLKPEVVILVEEHKVGRQRWLKWGLPREAIEKFVLFNEHTQDKLLPEILKEIKSGKRVFLLSDCGLPAFCDPGTLLVDACHKQNLKLTSTPFPNSIALAVALSGFSHERFIFSGFIPVKEPERSEWVKRELKLPDTQVWMETPYRLKKLLEDLVSAKTSRSLFLALELSGANESLLRGSAEVILKKVDTLPKSEFVLVIGPQKT